LQKILFNDTILNRNNYYLKETNMNNDFDICINKISIAHKFTMNKNEKCNYSKGRKYFGIAYFIAGQIKYDFSDGSSFLTEPGDIIFLTRSAHISELL